MKKIIAVLLSVFILVSFAGCSKKSNSSNIALTTESSAEEALNDENSKNSDELLGTVNDGNRSASTINNKNNSGSNLIVNNSVSNPPEVTNNSSGDNNVSSGTFNADGNANKIEPVKSEGFLNPVAPQTPQTEKSDNGNDVFVSGDVKVEDVTSSEVIPEQEVVSEIKQEIVVQTNHTPLAANQYYQYLSLNDSQKLVYNEVISAIKGTKNIVDISKYKIPRQNAFIILEKVLADHPEYFYVSRHALLISSSETNCATNFIIYYTDGKTIDKYENDQVITADNRDNIANQIKQFNAKVQSILNVIPSNCSQIEKEKIIHDYLLQTTEYDYDVLNNVDTSFGSVIPHAWDVYGALVEGKIVCEGYSKAFSYLCHCVGIDATLVTGYSGNSGHMWNAVKIDNEWYMVDVTWDDAYPIKAYFFFNITTSELVKTHIISSNLAYPNCTATKNSFANVYEIDFKNDELPSNYKAVLDAVIGNRDNYLILEIGDDGTDTNKIYDKFFDANSPVAVYLKEKGYNIGFESYYYAIETSLYLVIKYN